MILAERLEATDVPYRVLIAVPEARNIPYFALGVVAGRDPLEVTVLPSLEPLARVVSGNVARAVAGGRFSKHCLISSRCRVLQKTALYSFWLAFPEQGQAEAFAQAYQRLGQRSIEASTQAAFSRREADLRSGAEKGRYNLGPLEHRARLNRAREYVRLSEELEKLSRDLWALNTLRVSLGIVPDGISIG